MVVDATERWDWKKVYNKAITIHCTVNMQIICTLLIWDELTQITRSREYKHHFFTFKSRLCSTKTCMTSLLICLFMTALQYNKKVIFHISLVWLCCTLTTLGSRSVKVKLLLISTSIWVGGVNTSQHNFACSQLYDTTNNKWQWIWWQLQQYTKSGPPITVFHIYRWVWDNPPINT